MKKDNFDPAKQAAADEKLIKEFVSKSGLNAVRHESGLYYVVTSPGTGNLVYGTNTVVSVKYAGRLLDGQQFDANQDGYTQSLALLIAGWQIGIPLIQKGGKIRLLIPSALAYGNRDAGIIPPNSVLDFDVELLDASNK